MARVNPGKKLGQEVGGLIKGIVESPKPKTKPKTTTPKTTTPKATAPSQKPVTTTTGTTTPNRRPRVQRPITPSPKPSAEADKAFAARQKAERAEFKRQSEEQKALRKKQEADAKAAKEKKKETERKRKEKEKAKALQKKSQVKPKASAKKTSSKKKAEEETPLPPAKVQVPEGTVATPIGGPSQYADELVGDEFALARAADKATDEAARLADVAAPGTPGLAGAAEEVIDTSVKAPRFPRFGTSLAGLKKKPFVIGSGLATAGAIGSAALPEESPEWMQDAADLAQVVGSGIALKGIRGVNRLGQIIRGVGAASALPAAADLVGGGQQVAAAPPVEEIPVEQTVSPGDVFPGEVPSVGGGMSPEEEYLQGVQGVIDSMLTEAENDAAIGSAQVESSADAALQAIIDLYGGMANVQAGVAAQDPILTQELAAIEADYNAGMSQIANNYSSALATVKGYQDQANSLYNSLASQQRSAFEAAAGGLEMGGVPTGLTGLDASMAGISDTALGGAGITGAALTRSLGEAGQAGIAAEQMGATIDLGTALAQGRISQADLQAALGRDRLSAISTSRQAAAERASEERIRQQELAREAALAAASLKYERELTKEDRAIADAKSKADRKAAAAQYEAEAKMSLAQMVAGMSAEQYARWKGSAAGKSNYKTPSWYGKRLQGDLGKAVKLELSELPATVGSVNDVLDKVDAQLSSESARNPVTALATWQAFYEGLTTDAKKILQSRGVPTSAGAMYRELFKTPSK